MKYLFIQCFCVLNVCFKTFTSTSILDHKSNKAEIDDFIRQLLTSPKFDELADKIAEKAVNKIIKFEQGSQGSEIKLKSNLSVKNTSTILDNHRDKQALREDSNVETTKKQDDEKTQKYIGKINMQAFMKKDASVKSENLSLKYKYLTQKADKKVSPVKVHKEKQHKLPDGGAMVLRNNENFDKKSQKNSEHQEEIIEHDENDEIDNTSETHDYEEIVATSNENSPDKSLIAARENEDDKAEHYDQYDQNEMTNDHNKDAEYDDYKNMKDHSENEEDGEDGQLQYYEESVVNHDNDAKNTMRFSDVHQEIKNITIRTQSSENKTDANVKIENASKSNDIKEKDEVSDHGDDGSKDNEDAQDSEENKVTTQDDSKNKTLNKVRTEGDKKFIFQSSPEYGDYLEDYDKVHKDNPEKDFL